MGGGEKKYGGLFQSGGVLGVQINDGQLIPNILWIDVTANSGQLEG